MRLFNKLMLGAAAVLVATAANFPQQLGMFYSGTHPNEFHKREALKICGETSLSFVRLLASDRDECYQRMRSVGMPVIYSGVWSKPDRQRPQVAANNR